MRLLSARKTQRQQHDLAAKNRHKNSSKPTFLVPPPVFYQCPYCHRVVVDVFASPVSRELSCCGVPLQALPVQEAAQNQTAHHLSMVVWGGFDNNSLTVTLGDLSHPMDAEHSISWIYLYSFQGGQLKFLSPGDAPQRDLRTGGARCLCLLRSRNM